ncbi:MAG: glycosyltransferase family 2 protein [Cuniculiplasma sp.]
MTEKVSIIITAHDRKKYLITAVNSALSQINLNFSPEIIVVKNYSDEAIDKYLESKEVKNIYTEEVSFGKKLATGISNATGDCVIFLDDDDLMDPRRAEYIISIFNSDKELIFIHNNILVITEEGHPIKKQNIQPRKMNYEIFENSVLDEHRWSKLLSSRVDWYVSCMSMKRDYAESVNHIIRNSFRSLDKIMFMLSTSGGKKIALCSNRLTFYRRHESVTGLKTDLETFRKQKLNFTTESIKNIKNTVSSLGEGLNQIPLNLMIFKMECNEAIYKSGRKVGTVKKGVRCMKYFFKYGGSEYVNLSFLLLLHNLSPKLSLKLFRYSQTRGL